LNKISKKLPPGAAPNVQGYYAYTFNQERKPPSFHPGHTQEWQKQWLEEYDRAANFTVEKD